METLFTVFGILLSVIIIYIGVKEYLKLKKDRQLIDSIVSDDDKETEDLRITSMSALNVFVNFGSEFDYCKFHFTKNECFMYLRYSYPTNLYSGPFVIKSEFSNKYSYLSTFYIKKLDIKNNNEISICVKNKTFIGTKYNLNLTSISKSDLDLITENLSLKNEILTE
ncbi:hypothetical protein [Flavobacterium sp.]|uniref:hypothetical protein n=1 Tax=Flavobacterium sp. TaxID=239 RepID=UPI000EF10EAF|nr:hypothetical protein [Flavobacterium sp.]HCQ13102.1 hypothetical protein [Flavobacterium sp.]